MAYKTRIKTNEEITWEGEMLREMRSSFTLYIIPYKGNEICYGLESYDEAMLQTVRHIFQTTPCARSVVLRKAGHTVQMFSHPASFEIFMAEFEYSEKNASALSKKLDALGCNYRAWEVMAHMP